MPNPLGKTEKRDALRTIETAYQKLWQEEKIFESDAPSCAEFPPESTSPDDLTSTVPKFFGLFSHPTDMMTARMLTIE